MAEAPPPPPPPTAPAPRRGLTFDIFILIGAIMALIAFVSFFLPWSVASDTVSTSFNGFGTGSVSYAGAKMTYSHNLGFIGMIGFVFTLLAFILMLVKAFMPMMGGALQAYEPLMDKLTMVFAGLGFLLGIVYGGLLLGCVGSVHWRVEYMGYVSEGESDFSGAFGSYGVGYGFIMFIIFIILAIVFYKKLIRLGAWA